MTLVPARPRLFHITGVANLPSIIAGGLLPDAIMIQRGGPTTAIGMSTLKHRRLGLPVRCHAGLMVGDFVPFYFCPRSVMLYLLHKANEVHKLMYLSQEAGEPLKLRYVKGPYGPYAENLRHVLREIEGHYVSGYRDGGDDPEKQLELVPGALEAAKELLVRQPDTSARFDRVAELVEGFETPFGMELLATVHWVVRREGASSPEAAAAAVHRWNERKLQFSPEQIAIAWTALRDKGWLTAAPGHRG